MDRSRKNTMPKYEPPTITQLDDDNKLIEYARAFYAALVVASENVGAPQLEKTGKAIFQAIPWSRLDAPSRLIMVRTMVMFKSPQKTEVATPAPEVAAEPDTSAE